MGQAVKYAALGIALAGVIALAAGIILSVTGLEVSSGFTASVSRFLSSCASVIQNVKGALNYAFGWDGGTALNLLIWLNIILPLTLIPVRIVIAVARFINQ